MHLEDNYPTLKHHQKLINDEFISFLNVFNKYQIQPAEVMLYLFKFCIQNMTEQLGEDATRKAFEEMLRIIQKKDTVIKNWCRK